MELSQSEDLFTRRPFGGIFSLAFRVFFHRFDVFMAISAVTLLPVTVMLWATIAGIAAAFNNSMEKKDDLFIDDDYMDSDNSLVFQHPFFVLFVILLQCIFAMSATVTGSGAIARAVAEIYAGQAPGWLSCKKAAFRRVLPLLGSSFLKVAANSLCIVVAVIFWPIAVESSSTASVVLFPLAIVGSILGAIFVIYISISWIGTIPSIMLENKGPINGVKRSFELCKSERCFVLCALFVFWLCKAIINRIMHNIFLGGNTANILLTATGAFVTMLPALVFFPFQVILETVIYMQMRVIKEGMNAPVLERDLSNAEYVAPSLHDDDTNYARVSLVDNPDNKQELPTARVDAV